MITGNGSGIGTEQFSGTCSYETSGTFTPTCFVNDTITSNSCQGTVTITNPTPAVTIDKVDANQNDLDGNIGNDTQTVESGAAAVFEITVTNTGGEGLTNVSVTDPNGADCRLTEAQTLTRIQAQ